jgi:hypothetical protein
MKKLFAILCTTLLSIGVFAQAATEAGTFLLSGSTGLDFTTGTITTNDPADDVYAALTGYTEKRGSMKLDLMGGVFMMDGLAAGLAVVYESSNSSEEWTDAGVNTSNTGSQSMMLIAPTIRYYFGESGVWLQTQYGFGSSSYKSESKSAGTTLSVEGSQPLSALRFGAGYAIALSESISLNPSVGYSIFTQTEKADQVEGDGYLDVNGVYQDLKTTTAGLAFGLGIALHLGN